MTSLPGWALSRGSHLEPPAATPRGQEADVLRRLDGVTKSGNMLAMPRSRMSPVGASVADDIRRHEKADTEYRKVRARFARAGAVARLLIQFRMKHNLTQEQLAQLMGTSNPLGISMATTSASIVTTSPTRTRETTVTLRPSTAFTRPRTSMVGPSGVGRR